MMKHYACQCQRPQRGPNLMPQAESRTLIPVIDDTENSGRFLAAASKGQCHRLWAHSNAAPSPAFVSDKLRSARARRQRAHASVLAAAAASSSSRYLRTRGSRRRRARRRAVGALHLGRALPRDVPHEAAARVALGALLGREQRHARVRRARAQHARRAVRRAGSRAPRRRRRDARRARRARAPRPPRPTGRSRRRSAVSESGGSPGSWHSRIASNPAPPPPPPPAAPAGSAPTRTKRHTVPRLSYGARPRCGARTSRTAPAGTRRACTRAPPHADNEVRLEQALDLGGRAAAGAAAGARRRRARPREQLARVRAQLRDTRSPRAGAISSKERGAANAKGAGGVVRLRREREGGRSISHREASDAEGGHCVDERADRARDRGRQRCAGQVGLRPKIGARERCVIHMSRRLWLWRAPRASAAAVGLPGSLVHGSSRSR